MNLAHKINKKCRRCPNIFTCWSDFEVGIYNEKQMMCLDVLDMIRKTKKQ